MLRFTVRPSGNLPIEVFGSAPDALSILSLQTIRQKKAFLGNRPVPLGELFEIEGDPASSHQVWRGDLGRVCGIGSRMAGGTIEINGSVGGYTGARMSAGQIVIFGNAGHGTGAALQGGLIHVQGDTGDQTGSNLAGGPAMRGGTILVEGRAGNGTGQGMRRGVIAVRGETGDGAGYRMRAGTIVVGGTCGRHVGHDMIRGTVVMMQPESQPPAGFVWGGTHQLPVIPLLHDYLGRQGMALPMMAGRAWHLFHGDPLQGSRGEVLAAVDESLPPASI